MDLHHQRQPLRPSICPWRPSVTATLGGRSCWAKGRCGQARLGEGRQPCGERSFDDARRTARPNPLPTSEPAEGSPAEPRMRTFRRWERKGLIAVPGRHPLRSRLSPDVFPDSGGLDRATPPSFRTRHRKRAAAPARALSNRCRGVPFVTSTRTALILPKFPAHSAIGTYGPPSPRTRNVLVATRLFGPVDSHYAVDSVDGRS